MNARPSTAPRFRLLVLAFLLCAVPSAASAIAPVVAHAAGKAEAPENTIPAIQNALAAGAAWVEVDVRLSADGVVVLMHDATVDRTTDGSGAVASLTLAQLKTLDAGSWFHPIYTGAEVPTLAEALAVAGGARLLIDLKADDIVDDVAAVLASEGTPDEDVIFWVNSTIESSQLDVELPTVEYVWQSIPYAGPAIVPVLAATNAIGLSITEDDAAVFPNTGGDLHALGLVYYEKVGDSELATCLALLRGADALHATAPTAVVANATATCTVSALPPVGLLPLVGAMCLAARPYLSRAREASSARSPSRRRRRRASP